MKGVKPVQIFDQPQSKPRGKQKTHLAIIGAAQAIIADGRSSASIQEITERAGVGFGSFYNHFESKEELFAAAISATLDAFDEFRDRVVAGLTDPAEVFCVSFRMSGRLQRVQPQLVHILLNSGTSIWTMDRRLTPRAFGDIRLGITTGRFTVADPKVAMMLVGGAVLGMFQYLESTPTADGDAVADDCAEAILRLLGMESGEAHRLAHAELTPNMRAFLEP